MSLKCFSKANMLLSTEKKWNPTFCLLMERYLSGGERRWFALWIWLLYELPFVSFHLFSILALFRTANAYSHAHKTYAATIQQRQLSSSRSSSNSTNCTGKNNFSVQVSYLLPTFCVQWAGFLVFFLYRHRRRCCCCCWESKKYTQRPIFSLAFRCKFIHYIYIYRCCLLRMTWMGWRWARVRSFIRSLSFAGCTLPTLRASTWFQWKDIGNKSGSVAASTVCALTSKNHPYNNK